MSKKKSEAPSPAIETPNTKTPKDFYGMVDEMGDLPTGQIASDEAPIEPKKKLGSVLSTTGMGYIRDPYDARDYSARPLFGAVRNLPQEASLDEWDKWIWAQGNTSSCVGHALGSCIDIRLAKMGMDAPPTSKLAIYTGARMLTKHDPGEAIEDVGTYPRAAMRWIKEFGVPPKHEWELTEDVNRELPWDVQQKASAFRLIGWYRLISEQAQRSDDICQAIANGYPVLFGTGIDQAFRDFRGSNAIGPTDESRVVGGHAMLVKGYTTVNGERWFRIKNSWGVGWGDKGSAWVRESFLTSHLADDFYVIVIAAT